MKVAIVGAAGQLGQALCRAFESRFDVTALDRRALDITDHRAVADRIGALRPDAVVNCASFNDVDAAEDRPEHALEVNAFGVLALARAAAAGGALLVQYSTDFVFDGETDRPYVEEDRPAPQSAYAASKFLGELFAQDAPRWVVLRVESLFGGPRPKSSVDRIIAAIEAGEEWPVFVDRTVSPSYVYDVAGATCALIEKGAPPGVYHCVSSGYATWEEVALEAARLLGRPARLRPVRLADLNLKARRPRFCALSNARLASLGITILTWQDALARHIAARRANPEP